MRIETEAACRTAATATGKTVGSNFLKTNSTYPRGCYYDWSNVANFNTDAVGAGSWVYQLLCAAATTGAPHRCAHTRRNMYIDILACRSFRPRSIAVSGSVYYHSEGT